MLVFNNQIKEFISGCWLTVFDKKPPKWAEWGEADELKWALIADKLEMFVFGGGPFDAALWKEQLASSRDDYRACAEA